MEYRAIDTHCHPQFPQYDADRDATIRRALEAGTGMICVGTDPLTSRSAIDLVSTYDGLYCSVGIHPNDLTGNTFDEALLSEPKVVALGEVGLDYYRTTAPEDQARQREALENFLTIARRHNKPVIIHCRDAHEDMKKLLDGHAGAKGVIHSFTGTTQDALHYIERGFFIGLNGIITFARQYDDVIKAIPLNQILLETDSPYLAPASKRGKRNEPVYIMEVAQMLGQLKGVTTEAVLQQTTDNARILFKLL